MPREERERQRATHACGATPRPRVAEPAPIVQSSAWGQIRVHRSNPTDDGSLRSYALRREARDSNGRLSREPASPDSPLGQRWEIRAHPRHGQGESSPRFALRGWGSAGTNRSGREANHPSSLWLKPPGFASSQAGSSAAPGGHCCSGKGWEPRR